MFTWYNIHAMVKNRCRLKSKQMGTNIRIQYVDIATLKVLEHKLKLS